LLIIRFRFETDFCKKKIKREVFCFVFRLHAYVPNATATNAKATMIAATFEYSGTVGEVVELVGLKTG
jgi:hypothetical protein